MSRRITSPSRLPVRQRLIALVTLVAFLALWLLAASPAAHDFVHAPMHAEAHEHGGHGHDHDHGEPVEHDEHLCAVTLAAQGYCDTSAAPPRVATTAAHDLSSFPEVHTIRWTVPDFWLQPAQGPPERSVV